MKSLIKQNSQEIIKLIENIDLTFRNKDKNEEGFNNWSNACKIYHENYNILAFPGGLDESFKKLKCSDFSTIEIAIDFLEVNPYFFRSGYIKEEILSILKNIDLNQKQIARLHIIILNIVENFYCREFRYYCKLAQKISSKDFIEMLREKCNSNNTDIARRASWVLKYCKKT